MSERGSIIYLEGVVVDYDGFKALNNLNFIVNYNELRVVIGPNGAGKTTLLDVICGKTKPVAGRVIFGKDQELIGKREDEIVKLGIGRKFQAPSIYANLTVWENLDLSLKRPSKGVFSTLRGVSTAEERADLCRRVGTGEDRRNAGHDRFERLYACQGRFIVAWPKAVARNRHGDPPRSRAVAGG